MTDTDLVLKVGDRIADKYEILAIVGRGRMGTVISVDMKYWEKLLRSRLYTLSAATTKLQDAL